jgi:2,4-diaminopentanoate dehydrogenase
MVYRVLLCGTGYIGALALPYILNNPELELAGAWSHSDEKQGKDVGELCGRGPTGITITRDLDRLLAMQADAVIHTGYNPDIAHPDVHGSESRRRLEETILMLERGKNVVSTTLVPLSWPAAWGPEVMARLRRACEAGGSSLRVTGIHPGFMVDALLLMLSGAVGNVSALRGEQILDYRDYPEPERMRLLGYGRRPDEARADFTPGLFLNTYRGCIEMAADALGVVLDDVTEEVDFAVTDKPLSIAIGTIPAGTVGAFRFELKGISKGKSRISIGHVTRVGDDVAPDWPSLGKYAGYRLFVDGEPPLRSEVLMGGPGRDGGLDACMITAALAVNAVADTCSAPPGFYSYTDRPIIAARLNPSAG